MFYKCYVNSSHLCVRQVFYNSLSGFVFIICFLNKQQHHLDFVSKNKIISFRTKSRLKLLSLFFWSVPRRRDIIDRHSWCWSLRMSAVSVCNTWLQLPQELSHVTCLSVNIYWLNYCNDNQLSLTLPPHWSGAGGCTNHLIYSL